MQTSQSRSQHTQHLRRLGLDLIPGCELRVLAALMDAPDGMPPTVLDLCRKFGVQQNSVQPPLARLAAAGLVTREADRARTTRAAVVFIPADELDGAAWMVEADDGTPG